MKHQISINEVDNFLINNDRFRWYTSDDISRFIGFSDTFKEGESFSVNTPLERLLEIRLNGEHVGDVRLISKSEDELLGKTAEFFIIFGKRNAGVGSIVLPKVMEYLSHLYVSLYCTVHTSNLRSLKLLKKNGFYVEELKTPELLLVCEF